MPFAFLQLEGVGWGGSKFADGNSVQFSKLANCSVQSIEVVESRFPLTHMEYEIQPFRGGAGKHRGGFGSRRRVRVYGKQIVASGTISREMVPSPGLAGGKDGATNAHLFRSPEDEHWQTACEKFGVLAPGLFSNVPMKEGDEVLVITGNGAGYGNPLERKPESVLEDVRDELLSIEQAATHFGVVISNDPLAVNLSATAALRRKGKAK
jgi:N-methylhydantoinase B/oxoprolinase/acetone carboxylase alpha subunit